MNEFVHFSKIKDFLIDKFGSDFTFYVDDGIYSYRYGILDLKKETFLAINDPLPNFNPQKIARNEMPSIRDIRDSLLVSQSIKFGGIEKLIHFIDYYMELTAGAPLALGLDTNIVLNGVLNPFRETVEKMIWKGSLIIVVPIIAYQEINRLYLETYSRNEARLLKHRNIEGLPKKIARLSVAGLMNLTKLREVLQVRKFGEPVAPNVFTSSEAGRYFNDFIVREQIREYARDTGIPTLHVSADKDSVMMGRAEGTPSILIEIPHISESEYRINLNDFIYSLAILRGIISFTSVNSTKSESSNKIIIHTIWKDKKRDDWFKNIVQIALK